MPLFLDHYIDLTGNWIGLMGFLALCCQCITWPGIFLASWSQIGTWSSLFLPWRLHSVHPWWWDRDFRGNNCCTWWGHVDLGLIICRFLPLLVLNDIGMCWWNRFSPPLLHLMRYNSGFFTGCRCGGSVVLFTLSAALEKSWKAALLRLSGSRRCWKMALEVLGSSRNRLIHTPWWWHFMRNHYRGVE